MDAWHPGTLCRVRSSRGLCLLGLAMLASCSPPAAQVTYRDLRGTAVVSGCWPGNHPTPNPLTVTPRAPLSGPGIIGTPLPSTTPYPRCTQVPGDAPLLAYPTAVPTPVPYPTQHPIITNGGDALVTAFAVPRLHHVDVAAHPSQGWAAVAGVWIDDYHGSDGGPSRRIFVRVFNPHARAWGRTQQVNPPPAEDGNGVSGGVALGITGDGTVHVAWGGAATPGKPVWYAASRDYGASWSPPVRIGRGCYRVDTLGTTLDGQVLVLAWCSEAGGSQARPNVLQRRVDGTWLPRVELPVDGQHSSLVVFDDGADARAIILASNTQNRARAWIIQKRLADPGPWQIEAKDLAAPPGLHGASANYYLFRGSTFKRPSGADGIIFTWSVYGGRGVHALVSLDGGRSWGPVETVAANRGDDTGAAAPDPRWAAPAYDARSDRLVVVLVRRNLAAPRPGDGTHYAFWSVPGSGVWRPRQTPAGYEPVIPLISGATSATWTDTAQMANGSYFWLAWVNRGQQLQVRSLDFNLLVPPDQYPRPTAATGGGTR